MNKDIVPELLEKIQNEFKNKTAKSEIIKKKIAALNVGKATHIDSNEFAIEVGNILAEVFKNEITEDVLPDNKMYYNIAKRIIEPNMKNNFDIVSDYSKDVQEVLNNKSNISLKAIKPELNQDRIDGIVNKISEYDDFKEGKWLLDEPIKNFTQSIVDDTIKTNADFQYKSGLKPRIVRREAGNCCDWCKEVAGDYDYPLVPKNVYRRHQYCRCTVDYIPGDGNKQDVWSKKWTVLDENEKKEERINISKKEEHQNNKDVFPLTDDELIYRDPYKNILETVNYKDWEKSINSHELVDIRDYTGTDYYETMNNFLRGTLNLDDDVQFKTEIENKVKRLDQALSRFTTSEQYTVYRGTYSRHGVEKLRIGESFILDKGFASTSFSEDIAEDFSGGDGCVLYRIRIPKGKSIGGYVDQMSMQKGEEEFLFKPNTSVRLLKIDKKERSYGTQWVYDLEVD